jgi:TFIIF-interacting CTD phosphatase-like protein
MQVTLDDLIGRDRDKSSPFNQGRELMSTCGIDTCQSEWKNDPHAVGECRKSIQASLLNVCSPSHRSLLSSRTSYSVQLHYMLTCKEGDEFDDPGM